MTHRLLFRAALAAGLSFTAAAWLQWDGAWVIAWKGAGVALFAWWALLRGARQMALVMAFGALGDILLDSAGLIVGAVAFLAGHLVSIDLYRRARLRPIGIAVAAAITVSAAGFALTRDAGVALYALGLGAMAGMASVSRYPRCVAAGAWLFVLSDLLIFARFGELADSIVPRLLVWPLYFAGQALIVHGVVTRGRWRDDLYHRL